MAWRGHASLTERMPWMVAFVFGLLHGLGFAGALAEIGLPQNAIPLALLCFNIGVEIGQLLFVGAVLAVVMVSQRWLDRMFRDVALAAAVRDRRRCIVLADRAGSCIRGLKDSAALVSGIDQLFARPRFLMLVHASKHDDLVSFNHVEEGIREAT